MSAIQHKTEGLARPCSAWDLFSVSGGLQCGNCLSHNVPLMPEPTCTARASDGPCPLDAEDGDTVCWVHRFQRASAEAGKP